MNNLKEQKLERVMIVAAAVLKFEDDDIHIN